LHWSNGHCNTTHTLALDIPCPWLAAARKAFALLPSWFPPLLPVLPSENYTRRMWIVIVCGHRHLPPNRHCRRDLGEVSSDPVSSSARRCWAVVDRHQFRL
ncbi:hypothetical protein CRG98_048294, partial [Punica granatum]